MKMFPLKTKVHFSFVGIDIGIGVRCEEFVEP